MALVHRIRRRAVPSSFSPQSALCAGAQTTVLLSLILSLSFFRQLLSLDTRDQASSLFPVPFIALQIRLESVRKKEKCMDSNEERVQKHVVVNSPGEQSEVLIEEHIREARGDLLIAPRIGW